jgi:transcriptional regulator with XRE-family HTH domain
VDNDAAKDTEAHRLGAYLRARRALISPQRAGIAAGSRRRVPGLRREEVAMLAGISADYYLRLERGRDRNPSAQVLDALARVLELSEDERDYLHALAQPVRRARARRRVERAPARLRHLLAALDVPAFVEGRTFDVLAANPLALALSPRLAPGHNRLRSFFLDPEEREFHDDWDGAAAGFLATFRDQVGEDTSDARVIELVGELSVASGRFRELWARHDVRRLQGGSTTVHHPILGPLRLHRDKLPIEDVILVLYYADADSESAEKLRLLSALAAPTDSPAGGETLRADS